MTDLRRISNAAFVATVIGCAVFLILFLYVALQIYRAYEHTGIPVHGSSGIVGSLDAFWVIAAAMLGAIVATALVLWRAIRAMGSVKQNNGVGDN